MSAAARRPVLQGARGVVVAAIVAYHALRLVLTRHGGDWGDISPVWWWVGTARLGVDVFFVLAGFLVVGSWESCRERAATAGAALRDYAGRRCWRILPPYLVMLAVLVPLVAPHLLRSPHGWSDLVRLVTLQQYLDPGLTADVNVPIWSLTTEAHFYVVAPVAAWLLRRLGPWPLLVPAAGLAVWWAQTDVRGDLAASLLPGRLDQFLLGAAAGTVIARWEAGDRPWLARRLTDRWALGLLLGGLLGVGTYHGATYQTGAGGVLPAAVHPLAGLLIAGLLVRLVCGAPVRACAHRGAMWLGGISFSLYLWHYPILEHGLARVGDQQSTGLVALLAVALIGLSVAVAALAQALVERPAARRKAAATGAALAVLEPELRLEDLQEVPLTEGGQAGRPVGRGAGDAVPLLELPQVSTIDAQGGDAVALHHQPHPGRGLQHQGAVEEHVG